MFLISVRKCLILRKGINSFIIRDSIIVKYVAFSEKYTKEMKKTVKIMYVGNYFIVAVIGTIY